MAIAQQNTWFPNALQKEPTQTIYGATPWQTMQTAYQQPQQQLAANVVMQPAIQQTYQPARIRTMPDLSPIQPTVRPAGTMPQIQQQAALPVADPGGTAGTGGDMLPPGYRPPVSNPPPTPTTPTTSGTTGTGQWDGTLQPPPDAFPPDSPNGYTEPPAGFEWMQNPMTGKWFWISTTYNPKGPGIRGPETTGTPTTTNPGGAIPEPGYTPPTTPPNGPVLSPYSWGDPRYGRLGANVWDWTQGPPTADTPGGFWLKSPWADRNGGNMGQGVDTVYVPEGMTFGQFLQANPWFYDVAGPSAELVEDMTMKKLLENLLAEVQMRASDQYQYRPGSVSAQQYLHMTPSEQEMLKGKWSTMGLAPEDMWQMMLAAQPTGGAETKTRWL